jgi:aspartyl-tRNA(Asn)/glutamyl-tRNA(Gln) amidotransferase subunit C
MLELSPSKAAQMEEDLLEMVAFAGQLSQLDTQDVPPMTHIASLENVWREDTLTPFPQPEALLQNAPAQEDGYLFVPQVVE